MSQISKCLRVTVVLSYWEASGEVSELSYKNLLFDSSRRSYCRYLNFLGGGQLKKKPCTYMSAAKASDYWARVVNIFLQKSACCSEPEAILSFCTYIACHFRAILGMQRN